MADLEKQLDRVNPYRAALNTTTWTVAAIFFAATGVLLNAAAQQASNHAGLALIVGFVVAVVWLALVRRTVGYLQISETIIGRLETQLDVRSDFCLGYGANRDLHDDVLGGTLSARPILRGSPWLAALGWFAAIIFFMSRLGAFLPNPGS